MKKNFIHLLRANFLVALCTFIFYLLILFLLSHINLFYYCKYLNNKLTYIIVTITIENILIIL